MTDTIRKTHHPNYSKKEISAALERATTKVKYPYMWERLKQIENLLKIAENEYS